MARRACKVLVSGSILNADFSNLSAQIKKAVRGGLDLLHLDIADTSFTPTVSFGPWVAASALKAAGIPGEVHLMVSRPESLIPQLEKAEPQTVYFHVEVTQTPYRAMAEIADIGAKPGIAVNPATSLSSLEHILPEVDAVLVLLVEPGLGGQSMIRRALLKVKALCELREREGYSYTIAADGGIKPGNVADVARAGADIVVVGSAIFASGDPEVAVKSLKTKLKQAGYA